MRLLVLFLILILGGCTAVQVRDEATKVGGYGLTKLYGRLDARAEFDREYIRAAKAECETWKEAAEFKEMECKATGATSECLAEAAAQHGLAATCFLSKKPDIGLTEALEDYREFKRLLREE